jgi:hypothetical protein
LGRAATPSAFVGADGESVCGVGKKSAAEREGGGDALMEGSNVGFLCRECACPPVCRRPPCLLRLRLVGNDLVRRMPEGSF